MMKFFAIVELLLKIIGQYEQFADHMEAQRKKKRIEKDQARDAAVDQAVKAKTPEEAYAAQDAIVHNKP